MLHFDVKKSFLLAEVVSYMQAGGGHLYSCQSAILLCENLWSQRNGVRVSPRHLWSSCIRTLSLLIALSFFIIHSLLLLSPGPSLSLLFFSLYAWSRPIIVSSVSLVGASVRDGRREQIRSRKESEKAHGFSTSLFQSTCFTSSVLDVMGNQKFICIYVTFSCLTELMDIATGHSLLSFKTRPSGSVSTDGCVNWHCLAHCFTSL